MSAALSKAILGIVSFAPDELEYFVSHFREELLPKKKFLFRAGEICKLAVFCEKGCFRQYYVNNNGDEIVVDFAVEEYWIGDLASLINKVPTPYNFQALEDCVLQVMPYSEWERLSDEIPKFKQARQYKEQRKLGVITEMLAVEKYASAEEKYERLLKRFPGITNRVSALHIASYLGIKPESLSRLKRKFAGY